MSKAITRRKREPGYLRMFPAGGPDVAIGRISMVRSTITNLLEPEDDEEQDLEWLTYAIPAEGAGEDGSRDGTSLLRCYGDLRVTEGTWIVAATCEVDVHFRDLKVPGDIHDEATANQLSQTYSAWAGNVLYDRCLAAARTLIANSFGCDIVLPLETPEPEFPEIYAKE